MRAKARLLLAAGALLDRLRIRAAPGWLAGVGVCRRCGERQCVTWHSELDDPRELECRACTFMTVEVVSRRGDDGEAA